MPPSCSASEALTLTDTPSIHPSIQSPGRRWGLISILDSWCSGHFSRACVSQGTASLLCTDYHSGTYHPPSWEGRSRCHRLSSLPDCSLGRAAEKNSRTPQFVDGSAGKELD